MIDCKVAVKRDLYVAIAYAGLLSACLPCAQYGITVEKLGPQVHQRFQDMLTPVTAFCQFCRCTNDVGHKCNVSRKARIRKRSLSDAGNMWQQLLGCWLVLLAHGVYGSWVSATSHHS